MAVWIPFTCCNFSDSPLRPCWAFQALPLRLISSQEITSPILEMSHGRAELTSPLKKLCCACLKLTVSVTVLWVFFVFFWSKTALYPQFSRTVEGRMKPGAIKCRGCLFLFDLLAIGRQAEKHGEFRWLLRNVAISQWWRTQSGLLEVHTLECWKSQVELSWTHCRNGNSMEDWQQKLWENKLLHEFAHHEERWAELGGTSVNTWTWQCTLVGYQLD